MKLINLLIVIVLCSLPVFGQNKFSKKEIVEDLDFLKVSLEEAHYNLYTYVTKESFIENFEKVKSSITKDSLSLLETTSLFQAVISKANNGHTEIWFPGSAYTQYAYARGTLFPLELAFEDYKALVRKNLSGNNKIELGAELLSINGQSIDEILERIYPLVSAERTYFKHAKIELISFPRLYWQVFGEVDSFEVVVQHNEEIQKYKLKAVSVIEGFEMKRNEVFSEERKLQFLDGAAYLKPGEFGGDQKKYEKFIDSSFVVINKKTPSNLIIDLRYNRGGNDSYSDFLVSYIADHPFKWYSEFSLKTSSILKNHVRKNYDIESPYWKSVLDNEDGSIYPYDFGTYDPQLENKRYRGNVFVLVNRQSHSQSAVTAAQIQDYGFGTVVGEETGDYPSLYASQYTYNLPNTGIEVKISKGYIVRVNGSKKAEGVIPDIYIKDHLLDENDEILDGLLKLINL